MDNKTIFILDKNKKIIDVLSNSGNDKNTFFDDLFTQEINVASTFEFSAILDSRTSESLIVNNYIFFIHNNKNYLFYIVQLETNNIGEYIETQVYCESVSLAMYNSVLRERSIYNCSIETFLDTILVDTDFNVGYIDSKVMNKSAEIQIKNSSVYENLITNLELYDAEIDIRIERKSNKIVGMFIDVYDKLGKDAGARFEYGANLENVSKRIDISELYTAIIGLGKNGLTFSDVEWNVKNGNPTDKQLGNDFIADEQGNQLYNNSNRYIFGIYEDDECEDPYTLLEKSYEMLQKHKEPRFDYECKVAYIDTEEINLGDTVEVIDNTYPGSILLEVRINKIEISFSDDSRNTCSFSNYKEVASKIFSIKNDIGEISSETIVKDLNVEGEISAGSITVSSINCNNIPESLTSDIIVEVNSTSGDDTSKFTEGAIFATLQTCLENIPKFLGGNTVTINLNSVCAENVTIKGFNGGNLVININSDLEGNVRGLNCFAKIFLKGSREVSTPILKYNYKTTGNLNMRTGRDSSYDLVTTISADSYLLVTDIGDENWGYTTWNGYSGYVSLNTSYTTEVEIYEDSKENTINIKPSSLVENNGNKFSTYFENCNYVEISNMNVYGKTESNDYILGATGGSNIKIENVKTVGSQNGVYAYNMSKILEINTYGKVNGIAHKASSGSIISIENGTMIGGSIEKTDDSQIIYNISNVTSDESSEVGSNDNTTVASETIILKASSANTYRHNVYTGWKNDNTAKQGDYGYGDCDGYWFFDTQFEKLKSKSIKQITLKITRQSGGIYGSHSHMLRAHTYTSKPSGIPSMYGSWSQLFYADIGETATVIITDSTLLSAISNGTIKGFGVKDTYDKAHYSVLSANVTLTATVI